MDDEKLAIRCLITYFAATVTSKNGAGMPHYLCQTMRSTVEWHNDIA